MTNCFTTLAAAAALFIGLSAPAHAGKSTLLGKVGVWNISSRPMLCMSSSEFKNGTTLIFAIYINGDAVITIGKEQWNIAKGVYPIVASVDRGQPRTLKAEAEGKFVAMPWLLNDEQINIISKASVFQLKIGQVDYQYDLAGSGSGEMLQALRKCVGDLNRAGSSDPRAPNPFSGQPPGANW